MRILVVNGLYSRRLFESALSEVFPKASIVSLSDFRQAGELWIGDFIYNSKLDYPALQKQEFIEDVICRDRVLSVAERKHAEKLVRRCYNGLNKLFDSQEFDMVFSSAIDRYTRDLVFRVAEERGVFAVSPLGTFCQGYGWFTRRGELIPLHRNVTDEEAARFCEHLLKPEYLPDSEKWNVGRRHAEIIRDYRRRRLVEEVYFPIRRALSRDPDNIQWRVRVYEKNTDISNYFDESLDLVFNRVEDVDIDAANAVYLPMHLIPEATTSYWCDKVSRLGYLGYLLDVIDNSAQSAQFLIKEHPAMYGKRELSFYKELSSRENVVLIHPLDRSNSLLDKVSTVAVDTGTVGVEALLRGKRVLCLSDNYYGALHPNAHRVNAVSKRDITFPLNDFDPVEFSKSLLDGWFPSDYENGKKQRRQPSEVLTEGLRLLVGAYATEMNA